MDISFVIDDMGTGGAQRVVSVLSDAMVKAGHKVRIVITKDNENVAYSLDKDISLIFYKEWTLNSKEHKLREFIYKIKNRLNPKKADIRYEVYRYKNNSDDLAKYFESNPTDIIFGFLVKSNIYVGLNAKKIKPKVIVAERNFPDRPMETYIKKLRNKSYSNADTCVFQTAEQAKVFPNNIREKSVVIPNPVKEGLPSPFTGERKKIIVNYCGYKEHKNTALLIDAYSKIVKKHPEYTLELYGYGGEKDNLQKKADELGLSDKIKLLPFEKDIHSKVKDYAMFCMTSDYEGMPNALIEAMAIGLPAISTDCKGGGAKALIKNGVNGILTPIGDINKVAEAIEFYIENPDKAEEYAKNALKIRDELSVDKIVKKWLELV